MLQRFAHLLYSSSMSLLLWCNIRLLCVARPMAPAAHYRLVNSKCDHYRL